MVQLIRKVKENIVFHLKNVFRKCREMNGNCSLKLQTNNKNTDESSLEIRLLFL
jgi:hypothetical protein